MLAKPNKIRAIAALIAICLFVVTQTQGQQPRNSCRGFNGTTSPEALAYLRQDRATLEPECIYHAIQILRGDQYRPAIDVLFGYLDFEVPGGRPRGLNASMCTGGFYPAADLLCYFGKSVLPRVKQVIRDDSESALSRVNAAKIYFHAVPGPESIAFMVKAAADAGNAEATTKLIEFARDAVRYCAEEEKRACAYALDK